MKTKIILILVLFFGLVFNICANENIDTETVENSHHLVLGESFKNERIEFSIKWAELGRWIESWEQESKHTGSSDDMIYEKKPMIAVHYELRNDDSNKKLDLFERFEFYLRDEYGNQYHLLDKPKDYPRFTKFKPPHFPSIYPDESFAETLFFEAPIKNSSSLMLLVSAEEFELNEPLAIKIPMGDVQRTVEVALEEQSRLEQEERDAEVTEDTTLGKLNAIRIVFPRDGISVKPGAVVHINVELQEGTDAPNSIFVVSPVYVLEDTIPAYSYNFMVPKDQPLGELTIVVIGRWIKNGEEHYVSDSITFEVIDPKERCVENCISNTS